MVADARMPNTRDVMPVPLCVRAACVVTLSSVALMGASWQQCDGLSSVLPLRFGCGCLVSHVLGFCLADQGDGLYVFS